VFIEFGKLMQAANSCPKEEDNTRVGVRESVDFLGIVGNKFGRYSVSLGNT